MDTLQRSVVLPEQGRPEVAAIRIWNTINQTYLEYIHSKGAMTPGTQIANHNITRACLI